MTAAACMTAAPCMTAAACMTAAGCMTAAACMTAAEWHHAFQPEHMRNSSDELSLHFQLLQTSVVHRVTWGRLVVIIIMSLGRCPRECVLQENWWSCHSDFPRALKCSLTHSGHSFNVCWLNESRKTWHLGAFYLRSWEINERVLLNYVFMLLFPWEAFWRSFSKLSSCLTPLWKG